MTNKPLLIYLIFPSTSFSMPNLNIPLFMASVIIGINRKIYVCSRSKLPYYSTVSHRLKSGIIINMIPLFSIVHIDNSSVFFTKLDFADILVPIQVSH